MSKRAPIQNRITGHGEEDPGDLLANPMNHRVHPAEQTRALAGAVREVGWVAQVMVNQRTGHIVDGHARVELALRENAATIPVVYVDLSESEERTVLAAYDAITSLAGVDDDMLDAILDGLEVEDADLQAFLDSLLDRGEGNGEDDARDEARQTLAERFLVPPFTVLDGRAGYWLQRKRAWVALGIRSELGRGDDLTYSASCRPPSVHERKKELEREAGATYTWAEFAEKHPEELTISGTSIFDPVLCEIAYRWFCPPGGTVLDPFCGGSVRGIVAAMLGHPYTGIDLREEQTAANRANWHEIMGAGDLSPPPGPPDHTPEHTPVERYGDNWAKRDDMHSVAGSRGGKVRTCAALAAGATGLVTAGSRHSPQANIVAGIAKAAGIPARIHTASGKLTPELTAAQDAGAEVIQHKPGYNSVICARARDDAAETGYTEIPFGMECHEAVEQTAAQVANLPDDATRLVVVVGSGMSLAGVLTGLQRAGIDLPVLGIQVGADPTERLDAYAPADWRERVELVQAAEKYEQKGKHAQWQGIVLDPYYEAKVPGFIEPGDLFWIVGRRQTAEPRPKGDAPEAPTPQWIAGDALDLPEHAPDQFDLVFTCPPYGDLEVYSDDPRDLSNTDDHEAFRDLYARVLALAAERLRDNRFMVVVVGEIRAPGGAYRGLVPDTIRAAEAAGLHYYNEAVYITPVGNLTLRAANYFQASRKLGKGHQQALIFRKGTDVPDTDTPDGLAEAVAEQFTGTRALLEQNRKVLVFAKGDPKQATADIGPCPTDDPLELWAVDAPEVDE